MSNRHLIKRATLQSGIAEMPGGSRLARVIRESKAPLETPETPAKRSPRSSHLAVELTDWDSYLAWTARMREVMRTRK